MNLEDELRRLVHEEDYRQMGQIALLPREGGEYWLCHREDAPGLESGSADLREYSRPEDALEIVLYDDAEDYRPLKTAPSLRHGWLLRLPDLAAVREALDFFYPSLLGAFARQQRGQLRITPMLGTLGRQSGMYSRVRAMSAQQGDELCGQVCRSDGGCLRTIMWEVSPEYGKPGSQPAEKFDPEVDQTGSGNKVIPLLCSEICNLLVAKGREYLKEQQSTTPNT
jgi:sirohydrochlorin cobaltochelatase